MNIRKKSSWHLAHHLYRFSRRSIEALGVEHADWRRPFEDLDGRIQQVWIELAQHTQNASLYCDLSWSEMLEPALKAEKARLSNVLNGLCEESVSLRRQIAATDVLLRETKDGEAA